MQQLLFKMLPRTLQAKIRQSNFFACRSARRLAASSKRIDICAAQFAHILHLSQHAPLEGKICLEIGSGWVLTHALVCYLLGAKRVIATDIVPCAHPEVLPIALKNAIVSIPRDILAPFSEYSRIRERYERLLSIPHFSFTALEALGIEYKSPVNYSRDEVSQKVDFIYSNSVLEHVPCVEVKPLLESLAVSLNSGGTMIHCIHLEDHQNIANNPFDFLGISDHHYSITLQSERGNRIRCSEWEKIFSQLKETTTNKLYNYTRLDKPLPKKIASSISYLDETDLQISHVGFYTQKKSA